MAKRKTRRSSGAGSGSGRDMAAVWKVLIIFNILLTAFGFWSTYSQNNYMMTLMQKTMPISVPIDYKETSIVINPLTGQFMAVNSFTFGGTLVGILALVGVYFLLKETMY